MLSMLLLLAPLCLLTDARAQASKGTRLLTNRDNGKQLLKLPKEDDAFGFIVFGDRTGGPAAGIKVLDQAVMDTNVTIHEVTAAAATEPGGSLAGTHDWYESCYTWDVVTMAQGIRSVLSARAARATLFVIQSLGQTYRG